MTKLSIKFAMEQNIDYLYAIMVTPETIHIGEKMGFKTLGQYFHDDELFRSQIIGDEQRDFTDEEKSRIDDVKMRFGGEGNPIKQTFVVLEVAQFKGYELF